MRLLCPPRGETGVSTEFETVVSTKRCDCCVHQKMSLCPPSDEIVMSTEK